MTGGSPRVRGSHRRRRRGVRGSIPARAGQPEAGTLPRLGGRVHPRARGAAHGKPCRWRGTRGRSPLARGGGRRRRGAATAARVDPRSGGVLGDPGRCSSVGPFQPLRVTSLWYPPAEQACFHFRAPALLEVVRAWRRRLALRVDDGAATAAPSAPAEPLAPLVSRRLPRACGGARMTSSGGAILVARLPARALAFRCGQAIVARPRPLR